MTFRPLEGRLASGAAVASWGAFEVEVFAIHEDGQLWNRYWDGESWHPWESLGGSFAGEPGAAARDADRIDVFAIGRDGVLRHRWWDGSRWVDWEDVSAAPAGGLGVSCTWIGGQLEVFLRGTEGGLWHEVLIPRGE